MDEHGDHRVISTSSDEAQQRLHSHGSTQMSTIGRWKTLRRLHALVSLDEPGSGSCGPRSTSTTSHSLDPPYPIPIHLALFCGLALSFCSLLVISIHAQALTHPRPRPLIHNPTRRRARRQSAPGPLPKSCLGQGKHQMRVWASLALGLVIHRLCQYGPWGHGSIHTTMAQPLAFLILDDVCWELEPFRRRMVRRGMKSSPRNLSCPVPMQRPMSRLKRELGHKVVDRYGWVVDGCGCGCGWAPRLAKRGSLVACASLCERAQLPCLALGVSCVLCVSSVSQFFSSWWFFVFWCLPVRA